MNNIKFGIDMKEFFQPSKFQFMGLLSILVCLLILLITYTDDRILIFASIMGILLIKHTLADFYLQTEWQAKEKGYWGAEGGIIHSGIHGFLTFVYFLCLFTFIGFGEKSIELSVLWLFGITLFDTISHYIIDYTKARTTRESEYAHRDAEYWRLIGVYQLSHNVVYLIISYTITSQIIM